jgi:SAM-dependent methyltransferase
VVHVVDFHDVAQWLQPEKYDGRLKCHVISDNAGYSVFPDEYFDFCFSFGVLCHNNIDSIEEILRNVLPKMKLGGRALHQYALRSGGRAILGKGWEPLRRVPAGLSSRPILSL